MTPRRSIYIGSPRRWWVLWRISPWRPAEPSRSPASSTKWPSQATPAQLAMPCANLIENALVHTPPGTEVIVEVGDDGGVSVADRGPGIPAEDRYRVFDRFWRGQRSRNTGAGLGLSIVMEILRAHGASIAVTDQLPRGARFNLRFRTARWRGEITRAVPSLSGMHRSRSQK